MGKTRNYLNDKVKVKIIKSQNACCSMCKKQFFGFSCHIHHKNYNAFDNSLENLEALCATCHYKTRTRHIKELKELLIKNAVSGAMSDKL